MKKIRGHSRSRVSIRARTVRANVTRHYEAKVLTDQWDAMLAVTGRTAPGRR